MNDGDLVRIADRDFGLPDRRGMTGRIVALSPLYVTLRLTSTREMLKVPRCVVVPVDPTPQSVRAWRNEHLTWQRRNARVIARMQARREERVA